MNLFSDDVSLSLDVLKDLSTPDLRGILGQMCISNQSLSKELIMFESFLKRIEPRDKKVGVKSQKKRVKLSSPSNNEREKKLSIVQKCDIAARELDELRDEIQRVKDEAERSHDNFKAIIAETDVRIGETKKSVYEFERDIVRGAVNQRTGLLLGEKVFKYFEDKQRLQDALMEKLRLKKSSLKVRRSKLQTQLKQKEEAGEVRHEVDFEQLKIENKQYNEKFEDKNQELLNLKLSAGNALQVLNVYKKRLHFITVESESIDNEMFQRNELMKKLEIETDQVVLEKDKAEDINTKTKKKLEDFKVPDVIDYMSERASLYELSKTLKAWERKVEISEMALRTYKQTWHRLYQEARHFDA